MELDEHDDFQSFDFGPRNVASVAEEEAKSRGLQVLNGQKLHDYFVVTEILFEK